MNKYQSIAISFTAISVATVFSGAAAVGFLFLYLLFITLD
jgi:hypothetical protein